jgi:putative ubiquitin-RnfH superfamily antitoxin RatB of RatAB toxin-antitoxin module
VSAAGHKACTVAYAAADAQWLWPLTLPLQASIGDALEATRRAAAGTAAAAHIPWSSAPVGIFGELRQRSEVFADGDRIEIYRPLAADPRERRRAQVARARRGGQRPG